MRLRKSAHTVYRTQYRIAWTTRFRREIFIKGDRQYLETKFCEVRKYYPEWEYKAIGIDVDNVHIPNGDTAEIFVK